MFILNGVFFRVKVPFKVSNDSTKHQCKDQVIEVCTLTRLVFNMFSDDQTRVTLRGGNGDYINANYVNVS